MSNYVEAGRRPFGSGARDEPARVILAGNPAVGVERAAYYSLLAFVALLPFSIVASQVLLTITGLLWLAVVVRGRERIDAPRMFWPLAAYAAATLVSAAFSVKPETSIIDCKQLLLFSIVPIAYRLLPGRRALTVVDVIIAAGAISAVIGIVQFGILKFDHLGQRPKGALGMYMTYSGQLMLVACTAAARVLFRNDDRMWAALVMPALVAALAATLSRNAWVGACAGIGLLLVIRDFRFVALLPVAAAVFIALAPAQLTERFYSSFRITTASRDSAATEASVLSNRDRLAMIRSGLRIIKDNPLTGVGPDMVRMVYPQYRDREAVQQMNSHLHNVPLQIAAERGIPALLLWLWFMFTLLQDFIRRRSTTTVASVAMGALACGVALLAAGLFEYNFGDSEFLMLFLVVVTLPYAADRGASASPQPAA
jgi:putative inorganic carbon (HCO3(-)) transporter